MIFWSILLGLGVMRAVEWAQEIIPWQQRAWTVSAQAIVLSVLGVVFLLPKVSTRETILYSAGVAGISALAHAVETSLVAIKNSANAEWLQKVGNMRRPPNRGW